MTLKMALACSEDQDSAIPAFSQILTRHCLSLLMFVVFFLSAWFFCSTSIFPFQLQTFRFAKRLQVRSMPEKLEAFLKVLEAMETMHLGFFQRGFYRCKAIRTSKKVGNLISPSRDGDLAIWFCGMFFFCKVGTQEIIHIHI